MSASLPPAALCPGAPYANPPCPDGPPLARVLEGMVARRFDRSPAAANPYVPDTESHWGWLQGWRAEDARLAPAECRSPEVAA